MYWDVQKIMGKEAPMCSTAAGAMGTYFLMNGICRKNW
jgi:hypothetical protein